MRQRLGAVLCLLLGAVLIGFGLSANAGGDVGGTVPLCGTPVGVTTPCPTDGITFTESTVATGVTPPATWTVQVTSTCLDPTTGLPVNQTVTINDGGLKQTGDLYIYADSTQTSKCIYNFAETPVANYTTTYSTPPPVQLSDQGLRIVITNTYTAPTSSSASSSAPASSSHPASSSAPRTTSAAPTATGTSSAAPIASTGPHEQVRATVWIGAALCALGLVLLFAGRGRRRSTHAD